jgi:hypothetical protein
VFADGNGVTKSMSLDNFQDFLIYVYHCGGGEDAGTREEAVDFGLHAVENSRIRHITTLDDVKISNYPVYADSPVVLRSLASTQNSDYASLLHRFKNAVTTSREALSRATVMMNPEEKERFDTFGVRLDEDDDDAESKKTAARRILLSHRNSSLRKHIRASALSRSNLFDVFLVHCRPSRLQDSKPLRVLPRVSAECKVCRRIVFIEQLGDSSTEGCSQCRPGSVKRKRCARNF